MLISASSEFVALCRSQLALLTQGLGASVGVVYLTEKLVEDAQTKLIPISRAVRGPIVAYPEMAAVWQSNRARSADGPKNQVLLPSGAGMVEIMPRRSRGSTSSPPLRHRKLPSATGAETRTGSAGYNEQELIEEDLLPEHQLVLPLMHEGAVMGLLVTARSDRAWNQREQKQIAQIANTVALACILDQRYQWLKEQGLQSRLTMAQQQDVLDNLLHQFRNPLTALRTFGKLLLKRLLPEDSNRTVAQSIVRESDRLQFLLQQFDAALDIVDVETDDVLDSDFSGRPQTVAQKEARPVGLLPASNSLGSRDLTLESYSVAAILAPLLASAEAIAQERQLGLHVEIPQEMPPVQADIQGLREVLSNIIDNALKYTPAGGDLYVRVGVQPQGDKVLIAVSDTGPGIPPSDRPHVFERNYRGVQEETEIFGTGLGLAIASELVSQMQGEMQVFSPALYPEGSVRGTTFIVWLPMSAQSARGD
ncbi:MAG: GAF domain-containing sensor histidine kinase [Hormoscilla sp. GM102CHS1]|nr:GAF domain-containing sensor histidine kinase [Hormoscilla sp. GM102CHS1]